jgi:hypothetical protein
MSGVDCHADDRTAARHKGSRTQWIPVRKAVLHRPSAPGWLRLRIAQRKSCQYTDAAVGTGARAELKERHGPNSVEFARAGVSQGKRAAVRTLSHNERGVALHLGREARIGRRLTRLGCLLRNDNGPPSRADQAAADAACQQHENQPPFAAHERHLPPGCARTVLDSASAAQQQRLAYEQDSLSPARGRGGQGVRAADRLTADGYRRVLE